MFEHQVISNIRLNNKFNLLTFKSKAKFDFKIGQFVLIIINKTINRAYSFASNPDSLPFWQVFVDITPGGPGTTYLKNLKKGDIILTSKATGQFLLSNQAKYYIFAATGCGIAPFLPMIEVLLKLNKKVHIFWGLRYKKEITLKDKFSKWLKNPKFSYDIVLSQPEEKWSGKTGHVTIPLLAKVKSFEGDFKIYLSGSREFINEATKLLNENKTPANKIYFEACY